MVHFYGWGATPSRLQQGDRLLFTTQSLGVHGTHLFNPRRMKA